MTTLSFPKLLETIERLSTKKTSSFEIACQSLEKLIFEMDRDSLENLLLEIGTIPESISHDSTAEKLFAKAADMLLARSFHELGLNATVNKERADCADVIVKSPIHRYSLVGDAKTFRLSRTAKNQKDFKVKSLSDWRNSRDYAILVSPYFQYPRKTSQIYGQALNANVCLLSWEHLLFLIQQGFRETAHHSLKNIWDLSHKLAKKVTVLRKDLKENFHIEGNKLFCQYTSLPLKKLKNTLCYCKQKSISRSEKEIDYWKHYEKDIQKYDRKRAIRELLKALKIPGKIETIRKYIRQLPEDHDIE